MREVPLYRLSPGMHTSTCILLPGRLSLPCPSSFLCSEIFRSRMRLTNLPWSWH
jgi:hypothetical protein